MSEYTNTSEYQTIGNAPAGSIRFNTDSSKMEIYNGEQWWEIDATSPEQQTGGTRGLFGGGESPSLQDRIDFINVDTTGNAADFGDLSFARRNLRNASDRTRMIFTGGYTNGPFTNYNTLEFVTMASQGDVTDFGDLTTERSRHGGFSSSTRGFIAGGFQSPGSNIDSIEFVTTQSTGNAVDFGDMSSARIGNRGCQGRTRGFITGGRDSETRNIIEFVTMSTTGNAADFGDLSKDAYQGTAGSNAVRALAGAGTVNNSDGTTTMQFWTIATLGNAQEFGDLAQNHIECGQGACSPTRIVIPGSFSSNNVPSNKIEYQQIMTLGDFIDFGDLTTNNNGTSGGSNGHGGLG